LGIGTLSLHAGQPFALLIGVREYEQPNLEPLRYSENDVSVLADVLRERGHPPGNIMVLTTSRGATDPWLRPTTSRMRYWLRRVLRNRKDDDTVVIAFAGHGVQFEGSEESYLCPTDARIDDRDSLISLSEVYALMANSPAQVKVLLLDCCRND